MDDSQLQQQQQQADQQAAIRDSNLAALRDAEYEALMYEREMQKLKNRVKKLKGLDDGFTRSIKLKKNLVTQMRQIRVDKERRQDQVQRAQLEQTEDLIRRKANYQAQRELMSENKKIVIDDMQQQIEERGNIGRIHKLDIEKSVLEQKINREAMYRNQVLDIKNNEFNGNELKEDIIVEKQKKVIEEHQRKIQAQVAKNQQIRQEMLVAAEQEKEYILRLQKTLEKDNRVENQINELSIQGQKPRKKGTIRPDLGASYDGRSVSQVGDYNTIDPTTSYKMLEKVGSYQRLAPRRRQYRQQNSMSSNSIKSIYGGGTGVNLPDEEQRISINKMYRNQSNFVSPKLPPISRSMAILEQVAEQTASSKPTSKGEGSYTPNIRKQSVQGQGGNSH